MICSCGIYARLSAPHQVRVTDSAYIARREGIQAPGIGKGIGFAIALMILQLIGSLCQHHFFYRSTSTGVLLRGGLITAIYSRSLRLTTRARAILPNGRLVNHISTDVSRIRLLLWFLPHVLGCTYPNGDLSRPTDI